MKNKLLYEKKLIGKIKKDLYIKMEYATGCKPS